MRGVGVENLIHLIYIFGESDMKNILTFDVEEWFHANYCGISPSFSTEGTNFKQNMEMILALCSKYSCKATFFILGCIGENYREIVRTVADEGHDVATHGYCHELAYKQTLEEFTEDVKKSKAILEDVTGRKVYGYRAPSWSIIEKNLHYLEALEGLGIRYDASIFPTKNFLYGIPTAERKIHRPVVSGRKLMLYEVPTSVFKFVGLGVGYSGGFYFRFFPGTFIRHMIMSNNKCNMPSVVYLHPREIDEDERRLDLPLKERFIHYYNIGNTQKKLERVMKQFEFTSIRNYLADEFDEKFVDRI